MIAIIGGTGALGGALAKRLAQKGAPIIIGSRDPAKAEAAAAEINAALGQTLAKGAGLAEAAAQATELCFVAVPFAAQADTLAAIKANAQGKIVIDATVPLRPPRVGRVQLPESGSAVVDGAAILGEGVRVVSALQNIGAEKLATAEVIDADVLVCGDDSDAVDQVCAFLGDIGLTCWNAGPLANSAAAEAMTSILIQINRRYKMIQGGFRITGKRKEA